MVATESKGRVVILQHAEPEPAGVIISSLERSGLAAQYVRIHEGEPVPTELGDARALIVLGGPMGAYETQRYPHLRAEMKLIERGLAARLPVLGICLGSQLMASVLGARVRPVARKELGWHPIYLTPAATADPLLGAAPQTFEAFHWHGDELDLPSGATHLASSTVTHVQAFEHGGAYGVLFHLEVTAAMVRGIVQTFQDELMAAGGSSRDVLERVEPRIERLGSIANEVFARFARQLIGLRTPSMACIHPAETGAGDAATKGGCRAR